jgi:hypothetical protein
MQVSCNNSRFGAAILPGDDAYAGCGETGIQRGDVLFPHRHVGINAVAHPAGQAKPARADGFRRKQ